MGRPKFSFPLPGKKSSTKLNGDYEVHANGYSSTSIPQGSEWPSRPEPTTSRSKAERVLGTASNMPLRSSKSQTSLQQHPGYMTITVSEASYGSDHTDRSNGKDNGNLHPTKRPGMVHRPSSNILGSGYGEDSRRGSGSSSISRRLHSKASSSTMRSHYDPQSSPLSISQQTSASAVRDMALTKGHPQIALEAGGNVHALSPPSHLDSKGSFRKSKPARLDLSKLFPKPRSNTALETGMPLLSPNKMVNSPTALSSASEFFPRPMTREPSPRPKGQAKLTKSPRVQHQPQRPPSPVRVHRRDEYDNAKINVRRPPRGIQHWFEGFDDDDSDDDQEESNEPIAYYDAVAPNERHVDLAKEQSYGDYEARSYTQDTYQLPLKPRAIHPIKNQFAQAHALNAHRLNSPSQFSVQTQSSLTSNRTKESAFSKSNLQDFSVLSMSSSEDEGEDSLPMPKYPMRDSIGSTDGHGEIVIGQAQAFDVRPNNARRASDSKMSMLTTSTGAATIEVMYTPEPYTPHAFPRPPHSSRRSSHVRQPSMIPEDEDVRPRTAAPPPMSPSSSSIRSARTSNSEPRSRVNQRKMMAVTEEEEALLEMMRRKRAAMVKQSFSEGYETALKLDDSRHQNEGDDSYRTSGFLTMDSPSSGPVRVVNNPPPRKSSMVVAAPLLQPPPRGRPAKSARDSSVGTSMLRDSSSCDPESDRQRSPISNVRTNLPHQLAPQPVFSPLDLFPSPAASPTPAATEPSMASPTTIDHASPLPSPITPGLRTGEGDVNVKVASSEPSCSGDHESDDVPILETGVIGPSSYVPIKQAESQPSNHQRRRTASSGADVPLNPTRRVSQASNVPLDLGALSEASSPGPSINDLTFPAVPTKNSRRTSAMTTTSSLRSSSQARSSSPRVHHSDRRQSRTICKDSSLASSSKRDSVVVGSSSTRCSVSEDVLAAWGSLGGGRINGM
ncbi:hypothetical protein BU24DRAFT_456601 [Aaosphaeria arxii CBS 175.79]|uniref:Uncharacterized protein n=1 Tax=Aaosphaeria arxii CBS 175.79 TaxID=1450172 RepID=A0A6A5Y5Q2_9PLEO|nr:uncharacterized protein BU24DRAFT_456601 [Aaosphaeria arxii CBS 175.79]KAF2020533.1 hypothetical protein BU24DRAFT_456601 [Aaosphaeria arxii CBS 175.79]